MFIDESGQDRKKSPYEVLAGIAIKDDVLWNVIQQLNDAERIRFGRRYSEGASELKGTKILKKKVFDHAALNYKFQENEIPILAKQCLDNGEIFNSIGHLKALAQAKIDYVTDVFAICHIAQCRAFASVVNPNAQTSSSSGLRKDYAYLFERFSYLLEEDSNQTGMKQQGILVFDELEKSQSHILITQTHQYFRNTATGRLRAQWVIPEPFFVHSDLTTGVQVADLLAYCISWGYRFAQTIAPARAELQRYNGLIGNLRYKTQRLINGDMRDVWGFTYIDDLRTLSERSE